MTATPHIRLAMAADLAAVVAIEYSCFDDDAFSRRQLSYLISKAQGVCYVAVVAGEVKGYISLLAHSRRTNLRIYSTAVDATLRRQGVGRSLLMQAICYAKKMQFASLSLEVKVTNSPALTLYEKLGFVCIGSRANYYHDGSAAWCMRLMLNE
ncbi:MAG: N-acetyltransferase [Alistipes sp.]